MCRFVQKKVRIHGKPLYHTRTEGGIFFKHMPELFFGKLQHLHIADGLCDDGKLYFIIVLVVTRKNGAAAVEGYDFSVAILVLYIVFGCA